MLAFEGRKCVCATCFSSSAILHRHGFSPSHLQSSWADSRRRAECVCFLATNNHYCPPFRSVRTPGGLKLVYQVVEATSKGNDTPTGRSPLGLSTPQLQLPTPPPDFSNLQPHSVCPGCPIAFGKASGLALVYERTPLSRLPVDTITRQMFLKGL